MARGFRKQIHRSARDVITTFNQEVTMTRTIKPITSIACMIRIYDEPSRAALDQAIAIARENKAHLAVTIAAAQISVPYSPVGAWFASPMVNDLNHQTMTKAEDVAVDARAKAMAAGITADVQVIFDHVDKVPEKAIQAARLSDLIIVDQSRGRLDTTGILFEAALFHTGRPLIVASPRKPVFTSVRYVTIAWDGSAHAARAVGDAVSLFQDIEMAHIISISGEKDLSSMAPGADLAASLARKGLKATVETIDCKGATVGSVLDTYAARQGSDLLIMGGYGQSRLREFIFGGATIELTQSSIVSLFMAY
jgi:nucleotide-binding universal stress UspA family protein